MNKETMKQSGQKRRLTPDEIEQAFLKRGLKPPVVAPAKESKTFTITFR